MDGSDQQSSPSRVSEARIDGDHILALAFIQLGLAL